MRMRNAFFTSILCVNALGGSCQIIPEIVPDATVASIERKAFYSKFYSGKLDDDHFSRKCDEALKLFAVDNFQIHCKKCTGPCNRFRIASINPKRSQFYIISPKDEKKSRWEKICKFCKKDIKNSKKSISTSAEKALTVQDELVSQKNKLKKSIAFTELFANDSIVPRKLETVKKVNCIDFSKFERGYGEELSHLKKTEAIDNFNNFISFLRTEHEETTGEFFYVKSKRSI